MPKKEEQTPAERARVSKATVKYLQKLVKELPIEVLGHVDGVTGLCCRSGTVALVKVDQGDPPP